jgi:hypothetical protein
MAVSERRRRQLFDLLSAKLDQETAELMMEVTMPANVDLATRGDIAELRGEIAELRGELRGEMGELRGEMGELRAGLAGLEHRLYTRLLPIMSAVLTLSSRPRRSSLGGSAEVARARQPSATGTVAVDHPAR